MLHPQTKKRRFTKHKIHLTGFTLIEVLVATAILLILVSVLIISNFFGALQKGRDSRRKQDLNKMTRVLEDYFNDNQRYPPATDGKIAGISWGSSYTPYIPILPKDPVGSQSYYYDTDINGSFFVLYSKLENTSDYDIETTGCKTGCGPGLAYNYIIHSSNIIVLAGQPSGQAPGGGGAGVGGEGGGGGGGGGGVPTPTGGDPTATQAPLPTAAPPTPTFVPGTCGNDQLCNGWCGAQVDPPGAFCRFERCCYDAYGVPASWKCNFALFPCW